MLINNDSRVVTIKIFVDKFFIHGQTREITK